MTNEIPKHGVKKYLFDINLVRLILIELLYAVTIWM